MKGLSIHLTDMCNQSCKFCVVDSYKERKEEVNSRLIFSFLEENAGKGYKIINIHGGEATIVQDFITILKKIKELGYPEVSLQTNAYTLKDYDFAKQLVDLNVKTFVTSFHTTDPEEMAWLADVDNTWWGGIVQGIKNVKSLGARVRTNTVIYKHNVDKVMEIMEFIVKELRVDHINISNMHPAGRAYKNFDTVCPRVTEIMPIVKKAVDYIENSGTKVTVEGFPPCLLEEYTKYIVDWEDSDFKMLYHNFILPNYADFMSSKTRSLGPNCQMCVYKKDKLCGGIYNEYIEKYGLDEFRDIPGVRERY